MRTHLLIRHFLLEQGRRWASFISTSSTCWRADIFQSSTRNQDRSGADEQRRCNASAFSLPSTLWTAPWSEPLSSGEINVESIESLRDSIFDKAQHADQFENPPMFELTGSSTSHLAEKLVDAVKEALQSNNFERVLSPSRDFAM